MANKIANVSVRVEPEIKEKAEAILARLGLPVSVAIDTLYRQIIMTGGLPYSLSIPTNENSTSKEDQILKQAKIGDKFEFGEYKFKPILWRVLDKIDGKLLVISEYILEHRKFDDHTSDYNKSAIKKWLEKDFKSEAFRGEKYNKIDKIYILSKEEVEKYFKTPEERIIKGYEPTYYWWTSSKREGSDYNACLVEMVDWKGEIACQGHSSFPTIGVRVACLINV